MDDVSEMRLRETRTYFDVIARGGSDRLLDARSFHNLGEYTADDFDRLVDLLDGSDASGSFAFLGRDAGRYADSIGRIADAGHDVVLHGYRHVAMNDASYEFAYENFKRGLDGIEEETGVRPSGYFPPLQELSWGAIDAAAQLGFGWVFGATDAGVPSGLTLVESHDSYDLVMLNRGDTPAETFSRIESDTRSGVAFLFHPNMLECYDAMAELEAWVDHARPASIDRYVRDGGVGVLLDAMRPLRIE